MTSLIKLFLAEVVVTQIILTKVYDFCLLAITNGNIFQILDFHSLAY
jgi:hypothetical protein